MITMDGKREEEVDKTNMELETSESSYPGSGSLHIPIDLFGSKKHAGAPRGVLAFADALGNILFTVNRHPPNRNYKKKLLLDASGNIIFSIYRHEGSWKCYKGNGDGDKDLVFRVERTLKTLTRVELEVFFDGERPNNEGCDLKLRGSPFQRSCSIYKDTDLVAQASLMYKLHQLYVSRGKFCLTIFPGTLDNALVVALFVIFLNGRK
ncbi:protein LURP-one-related 7 isoform X2 [Lotus japonicus]|uniref:protein LURP-one-related 7 isoform X2 n=1 Tax=Lotus japonicus TaxID=34305 RepID=UPI00258D5750|nr:protein LURP-one-related 7 isoform X2 [Lotus japonicus]